MADERKPQGTVVRGADGSLYFLRPEVMEATKVTEPEMVEHLNSLVDRQAGLNVNVLGRGGWAAEGTIMCPGTISDVDLVILPTVDEQ